jgi:hypothetical protein
MQRLFLLLATAASMALAAGSPSTLFNVFPATVAPGDAITTAAPSLFLSESLVAITLYNEHDQTAVACLSNPQLNSGTCLPNTTVVVPAPQPIQFTQIIQVTATSVLFVMSQAAASLVAYVDTSGVRWNEDRYNCTGPVAYDPRTDLVIVSVGHELSKTPDTIYTVRVQTASLEWFMTLSNSTAFDSSQFGSAMFIVFGRVWFTYAQTLYGVDVANGFGHGRNNSVVIEAPCGLRLPLSNVPGCPLCVTPFTVNLMNPKYDSTNLTTLAVSGKANSTGAFAMCGYTLLPGVVNVTQRWYNPGVTGDDFVPTLPFVTLSAASSTHGNRSRDIFFASGRYLGTQHALLTYDLQTGQLLHLRFRSAADAYSVPVELSTRLDGSAFVALQIQGQLSVSEAASPNADPTTIPVPCSVTAAWDSVNQRLFCINGTSGILAINVGPQKAGALPALSPAWRYEARTRGAQLFAGLQTFHAAGGEPAVGAPLAGGAFAAVTSALAPPPTSPPSPAPDGDDDHKLSAGIVVLIVAIVVVALAAGGYIIFRRWRMRRYTRRRGVIDSALSYKDVGLHDEAPAAVGVNHSSVAPHSPASGYGSIYA